MYSGYKNKHLETPNTFLDMGFQFNNYPTSKDKKKFNKTVISPSSTLTFSGALPFSKYSSSDFCTIIPVGYQNIALSKLKFN